MESMYISSCSFPRMTADQFLKHQIAKKKQETKSEISFAEILEEEIKKESSEPTKAE